MNSSSNMHASPRTHSHRTIATIIAAALIGLITWVFSGAYAWRGYPADHAHGTAIAVVLGLAAQVTLAAVATMSIRPLPSGRVVLPLAVAAWTIARLTTSSLFPLISDEAYHWLWAGHLDLGYYDHPGMVAWLARLFAPWHGEAAALVRLSSVLLGTGIVWLVHRLARSTTRDHNVADRAALLFMLVPLFAGGSMILFPSMSVYFFWWLTILLAWRAMRGDRLRDWALMGLAWGASTNANFTTFMLPAWVGAFLLLSRRDRRFILRPGPYVALLAGAVGFLPTLIWNATHDWDTLAFNFVRRHTEAQLQIENVGLYVGGLLLMLSPVLGAAMLAAGARQAVRAWREQDRGRLFLACMGWGPVLAFLGFSLTQEVNAHYAGPGFVPLLILFCDSSRRAPHARPRPPTIGTRGAHACTAIMFAVVLAPALIPADTAYAWMRRIAPQQADRAAKRTAEVYGWSAIGAFLDGRGERFGVGTPQVLLAPSYAQASMLMHYARGVDLAYNLGEGRSPFGQQFRHWGPLSTLRAGCEALIVYAGWRDRDADLAEWRRHFDHVEAVSTEFAGADARLKYFTIYRGVGYRGTLRNAK